MVRVIWGLGTVVTMLCLSACSTSATRSATPSGMNGPQARVHETSDVDEVIRSWPEVPKKAARMMIEKYGPPDGMTPDVLIWHDSGPWLATVVTQKTFAHDFPMGHEDCLEHYIPYKVPPDMFDDLARFDGSVVCERTAGLLSARCDKEEANFLAINLAHEIVTGQRTVEQAREECARALSALQKGQKPPMTQRLLFEVATLEQTADRDTPARPPSQRN